MKIRPDAGAAAGKNVFDMLYEPGSLHALYIMGEDPVSAFPNSSKIIAALKSLEFVIVQDIAMTETAKFAHVVLPAASWAEKEGTFINAEGITQKLQKIVAPEGQSMPDWQILRNLSLSMGREIVFRSIEDVSAGIKKEPSEPAEAAGNRTFQPVSHTPGEDTDDEYPIHLVIRDVLQHSGTMSTRSKALDLVVSEAFLEINEEEAEKYGLTDNSHVKVSSRRGAVYLKAKITDTVPGGVVFTSMHFPHGRVNALTYPPEDGKPFRDVVKIEAVRG